jgi:membrane associated rhomboid family serine protease
VSSDRYRFCPSCGTESVTGFSFCGMCGKSLSKRSEDVAESSNKPTPRAANVAPTSLPKDTDAADNELGMRVETSTPVQRPYHISRQARRPQARTALIIVLGILVVLWIIQIINSADHYRLTYDYGIQPRMVADLPYIFSAPFLHFSSAHIEGNSVPLVVLGFLAAYRSIPKFIGVTAVVIVTSGLASWLFDPSYSDAAGASGVISGWFGYVIVRGFFSNNRKDIVIGVLIMIFYLPLFTLLLPAPHLGFEAHIGGLVGGVLCGWIFRPRIKTVAQDPGSSLTASQGVDAAAARLAPVSQVDAELAALREQILHQRHYKDRTDK